MHIMKIKVDINDKVYRNKLIIGRDQPSVKDIKLIVDTNL